jgi:Uma2 family endonuclease
MSAKPAFEYLDGVLRQKSTPTKPHVKAQHVMVVLLRRQGLDAFGELLVRLSPTKFLVPDVVAADHLEDPCPTEPVTLCVEILSPGDRVGAAFAKCDEYHAWGVPYCWVLDPVKQTAWEYHAGCDPAKSNPRVRCTRVR